MIKYHFQEDDGDKCRELLTMISKNIFQENYEGLTYKEATELRIKEKLEEKDLALERSNKALEEKDLALEEKDKEIKKLKQQLSNQK